MRLAVYHPWLKEKGGAEKVITEIARRSFHDIKVLTLFYDGDKMFDSAKELDIEIIGSNEKPRGFIDKGLRFGLGSVLTELDLAEFDALIVSEAGLGSLINLRNHDIPIVGYCHTPLRPALPEFKKAYRREVPRLMRPLYGLGIKFYEFIEKRAWSYFDFVFANSALTQRRILEKKLTSEDRVSVLNPGVEAESNESGKREKYFLYPSRFRRYKRQDLAIRAFQEAGLDGFELVLAGSAQEEEYVDELREMAGDKVRIETDVPDERWEELYSNCYAVLFLAEKEDWGMVPIEAGSFGKPTVAVNEGGPRESVVDGETGFLVEADPVAIADKMMFLAESEEDVVRMGKKARENSLKYSWNNFIEEFDTKVSEVVGE